MESANPSTRQESTMKVEQIKDQIRTLNPTELVELFRWLDREIASSDRSCSRIGIKRSLDLRREIERKTKVTGRGQTKTNRPHSRPSPSARDLQTQDTLT